MVKKRNPMYHLKEKTPCKIIVLIEYWPILSCFEECNVTSANGGQSPQIMDGFFVVKKQKLSNFPKQVEGDGVGHLYFDSLTLPHNYPNYK